MERTPKPIWWAGSSKEGLLAFPENAVQDAGYQLHRLQESNEPQDWKLLKGLGKGITGVYEIRIWEDNASFRLAYVSKFAGYVTVLNCWQKNTQKTTKANKDIIVSRYKEVKESLI